MANNNEDITIKVSVDTSDVEKSFKDISKESKKMSKDIEKSNDKVEKSFEDVKKTMNNTFKNINFNSLANSMKQTMQQVQKQVQTTANSIKSQLQKALNLKGSIDVKTNMTTGSSNGSSMMGNFMGEMLGSSMSSGAIGSQIAKQLAQTQPVINKTVSAWKSTIEQADLFEKIDDDFIEQMDKLKSEIYPTISAIKDEMSKELSDGEEIEFNYDFDDFTNGITIVKQLVEDLYSDLNQPLQFNDEGLKSVRADLREAAKEVDNFSFGLSEAAKQMLELTKPRGLNAGFSEEKLQKSLQLLQQMQQELADLQHVGLGVSFTETLEGELSKITSLAKTFENNPLKMNAEPLIEEFKFLQQEADKVGLKLKGVESVLQQYSQVDANATKLTNGFKNSLSSLCQQFTSYAKRIELAKQKQQELATTTNRFQKAMIQAKYGLKQFGSTINNMKSGFKDIGSRVVELGNRIQEWASKHKKATNEVKNANKNVASSFKIMLQSMLPFLTLYGAFGLIKDSITGAMDSIETTNMYMAVFGKNASEMDRWIKQLNKDTGLGIGQTKEFTAIIGQMGQAMGLTSTEAMEMSKSMATMAGDISSFYNADITQVQEDLRSALSGSYETMDKYGVVLRQSTIEQFAYANGIARTGAELTNAQRAMATTMYIEQALGQANGDLAKTMDTPAGRARRLTVAVEQLKVALGNMVLPIWNAVMPGLIALANALTAVFNKIASIINGILSLFGMGIKGGTGGGGSSGGLLGDVTSLGDTMDGVGGSAGDVADNLDSASGSAKEIKKYLSGLDALNLTPESSTGSGSGGSSGGSGGGVGGGGGLGGFGDIAEVGSSITDTIGKELSDFEKAFLAVFQRIKMGFMMFADEIQAKWAQLKHNIDKLGQEIVNFFVSCWRNGLDNTAYLFGGLLGAITSTMLGIANIVVESTTKLFQHLNPDNNEYTKKFIEAFNNMLLAVIQFVNGCDDWLQTFMDNGGQDVINTIGDIILILGTGFIDVITEATTAITDFLNSPKGQEFIKSLAQILLDITEALKDLAIWVVENKETILKFAAAFVVFVGVCKTVIGIILKVVAVAKTIKAIKEAFDIVKDAFNILKGIKIGAIIKAIASPFTWLWKSVLVPLGSAIMTGLTAIASFFGISVGWIIAIIAAVIAVGVLLWQNWDTIVEKCGELWKGLQTYWTYIWDTICDICSKIWTWVCDTWDSIYTTVVDFCSSVWSSVKEWWNKTWNTIKEFCTNMFNTIKEKWEQIKNTLVTKCTEMWNRIKEWWNKIWNTIKEFCTSIWNSIKEKWEQIKNTIIEKVTALWNKLVEWWTKIKTTIITKCTELKQEATTKWEEIKTAIVDKIIELKNKAVDKVKEIKEDIIEKFNELIQPIKDTWDDIWGHISPIIEKLKNAFNFDWKLPDIKLPKVNITKKTGLFGLEYPSFDVSWNAAGGVFDSPTIFNTARGLQGVGEAGSEAIIPLTKLWDQLGKQFDRQNQVISNNTGNQTVVLNLDGKQIAKGVFKNAGELAQLGQLNLEWL